MIICKGYKRDSHPVKGIHHLHALELCESCYQKKWRDEHQEQIAEYRKQYREDKFYRELNRGYVEKHRKRKDIL